MVDIERTRNFMEIMHKLRKMILIKRKDAEYNGKFMFMCACEIAQSICIINNYELLGCGCSAFSHFSNFKHYNGTLMDINCIQEFAQIKV